MANKVGQIIYNVQDYYNSGGYVSSSIDSPLTSTVNSSSYTTDVTDENKNTYKVPDWDKYKAHCYPIINPKASGKPSIISAIGPINDTTIKKLGIQAPSGTKVHLNSGGKSDEQIIMIGRTGMYELDENISITDIYFERPRNYILDEEATAAQLLLGKKNMRAAEEERENKINLLNEGKDPYNEGQTIVKDSEEYWACYIHINDDFQKAYDTAKGQYNIGVTGIYKLPNKDNPYAEENYKELYNIIIDFEY
jgi:hypothetical protein